MTYADNYKHPTSNRSVNSSKRIDNRTKSNLKQASERKLCYAACGRETENKLLLQISEAEQVSDFERILNSNAILRERARRHVWRGNVEAHAPSASLLPRPRSTYSLRAVSQAYHTLFRQHEESVQQLVDRYRQEAADLNKKSPSSLLDSNWFEDLHELTEFYEDDPTLQKEIETITDRIIAEAAQTEGGAVSTRSNFSVNLAGLISLHVNGEGVSPTFRDDLGLSPEVEKVDVCDDKEWLSPIMSAKSDDRHLQDSSSIDRLAQGLNTVQIECDGKVPTITFSNCCEGHGQSDKPNNNDVVIHLAVPSIESPDEARPPMM
ncbi:uncharacterized protein LOC123870973 [Maniola jurtina]|uniref:uncharacterized protein LOC123870973 n=1 Tax=Maniola jurtina TaxID=191418 RepID=UPI001E687CC9|nr:uncharacterized protein LOC123870973 [Maniola jurtina]